MASCIYLFGDLFTVVQNITIQCVLTNIHNRVQVNQVNHFDVIQPYSEKIYK